LTTLFVASEGWVHVGDRESDNFELFCKARDLGTHIDLPIWVLRVATACSISEPTYGADPANIVLAAGVQPVLAVSRRPNRQGG
jgi:hypothetical protein